jgi:hypothetical protein
MCYLLTFLFHSNSSSFFFLLIFFNKLQHESYGGVLRHYGSKVLGVYPRPLNKALLISFGGTCLLSMEDCVPFAFKRSGALATLHLCLRFHIFNKHVLEKYAYHIKGCMHLL